MHADVGKGGLSAVAIIGMAGRFPDAATLDEFWENLGAGRESLHDFADEEILAAGVPLSLLKTRTMSNGAHSSRGQNALMRLFLG